MQHIAITPAAQGKYHAYRLFSSYDKESIALTPAGLLELARWIAGHQAQLEQEARENEETEARDWEKSLEQSKRAWGVV